MIVTWDPSYFALESTPVSVQVRYSDNTTYTISSNISSDIGYSVWAVDEDILTQDSRGGSDLIATLYLTYDELDVFNTGLEYNYGPKITISTSATSYNALPENRLKTYSKTVAIAVSVAVIVVLLALGISLLWCWRRNGNIFGSKLRRGKFPSKVMSSVSNFGWPEDKSHPVELTASESWGPTQGKNVFREEIRRQETIRGS